VTKLNIRIPALIDTFENTTETAYTGWPDRIYVIDRDGRVAFKTTPGPFGFETAGMEQALKKMM
jgi:type I thyroxine 5'-deiodinase